MCVKPRYALLSCFHLRINLSQLPDALSRWWLLLVCCWCCCCWCCCSLLLLLLLRLAAAAGCCWWLLLRLPAAAGCCWFCCCCWCCCCCCPGHAVGAGVEGARWMANNADASVGSLQPIPLALLRVGLFAPASIHRGCVVKPALNTRAPFAAAYAFCHDEEVH